MNCPKCQSEDVSRITHEIGQDPRYHCKNCMTEFSRSKGGRTTIIGEGMVNYSPTCIESIEEEPKSAVIKAENCINETFNPIDFKTDELKAILLTKNNDYGKSFDKLRTEYGMTATLIRLEDKLNRIKVLTKKDAEVKSESIEDTLMDLAGYCILELVYRMEKRNDQ